MSSTKKAEWLSYEEVLSELEVSRSTFDKWRATGKAPSMKKLPNGQLRCKRADLDEWLDQLEAA